MKKLKLGISSLGEMLTKDQMKKITGGYVIECSCDDDVPFDVYCDNSLECILECERQCRDSR